MIVKYWNGVGRTATAFICSVGRTATALASSAGRNAIALTLLAALALGFSDSRAQDTKPNTPPPAASATSADNGTQVKNATSGVMQDRSSTSAPAALYVEKCSMCHRQMGMGTIILARRVEPSAAMLEARADLTESFVIQAARAGIGNMPRISKGEVSDEQL